MHGKTRDLRQQLRHESDFVFVMARIPQVFDNNQRQRQLIGYAQL
jgi:hypothetical protein